VASHTRVSAIRVSRYTSIGNVSNTMRNPALRIVAPDGSESYLPAYLLSDQTLERAGRL